MLKENIYAKYCNINPYLYQTKQSREILDKMLEQTMQKNMINDLDSLENVLKLAETFKEQCVISEKEISNQNIGLIYNEDKNIRKQSMGVRLHDNNDIELKNDGLSVKIKPDQNRVLYDYDRTIDVINPAMGEENNPVFSYKGGFELEELGPSNTHNSNQQIIEQVPAKFEDLEKRPNKSLDIEESSLGETDAIKFRTALKENYEQYVQEGIDPKITEDQNELIKNMLRQTNINPNFIRIKETQNQLIEIMKDTIDKNSISLDSKQDVQKAIEYFNKDNVISANCIQADLIGKIFPEERISRMIRISMEDEQSIYSQEAKMRTNRKSGETIDFLVTKKIDARDGFVSNITEKQSNLYQSDCKDYSEQDKIHRNNIFDQSDSYWNLGIESQKLERESLGIEHIPDFEY